MTPPFAILGLAGRLRRASYNRALLRAAQDLAPAGVVITIYEELGAIPPYNADVEEEGDPVPVRTLKPPAAETAAASSAAALPAIGALRTGCSTPSTSHRRVCSMCLVLLVRHSYMGDG